MGHQGYLCGYLLEPTVDFVAHAQICAPFVDISLGNYRQKVVTIIFGTFPDDILHLLGSLYRESLDRLPA
ncbi:MAG: hypothetical protein NC036_00010 [Muribaculaceae bacterium]|nr:hypothetical protein [Muribaculaceae bacterium]